ncbi:type IVB secretion system protein IcmG/DotF [Legionella hackeliae]|uniref:Component of the Dot/Icm secretion system n=1 Tax=Legionella hackeliae TaxID=449 RepID=A0A0A8URN1_LEGHA|nr:type IVB secretion system protein IcmG/DotF [Legionella hackeliae]KTD15233.1 Component of the Dot/Icm secretion system [Legionella hackeliae]CEK11403.1 Component of the Dot/Icm secretion system [Legionella hackeliae]STX48174.1 Component of the Dot/Icm secretion system [Legionella hackeliae]
MVDDDKNEYSDEYQFSDLDVISPDSDEEKETTSAPIEKKESNANIRRNALVAIVVIVVAMLAYKFLGPLFTKKPKPADAVPTIATPAPVQQPITPPQPIVTPTEPPPTAQTMPVTQPTVDNSEVMQRLSALEASQQNLRSDLDSLTSQVATINTNINALATKIAQLNQTLTVIVSRVEQQSKEISVLTVHVKPKPVARVIIKRPPPPSYFIQAIIPGRAWLIAQNGSTITVREGTQVAGYGVIKLIDSRQGRVLTSSGRVIRFSQQDS